MGRIKSKFNYRHVIAMAIVIASLLCSIFFYPHVFVRTKEMVVDLLTSFRFYIVNLANPGETRPETITSLSSLPSDIAFPLNWEEFKVTFVLWWRALWTKENFSNFWTKFSDVLYIIFIVLQLLIMLFLFLKALVMNAVRKENTDHGQDTKALKCYKKFEKKVLFRIKFWVKDFISFFKAERKIKYSTLFLVVWLFNLNILTIFGEVIAYLFYFVSSVNIGSIFVQIYKLLFDVVLMFRALPWYVWVIVIFALVVKFRTKRGYKKLNHMQAKNCGFVKSLSLCTLFSSPMGFGKTKLMMSMFLTATMVFKESTKESLFKAEYKFPNFPFVLFEDSLRAYIKAHKIFGLATIEEYVHLLEENFVNITSKEECTYRQSREAIFGYYWREYGLFYDNGMYKETLFEVLETYAKAFYVYSMETSFGVSNFAIREDNVLVSLGNFPVWDFDFFKRSSDLEHSYYTKILDFDILRKGKKVIPANEFADTFEFGVVVITELDKERGNTMDTSELKKFVDVANQKNDLFNYSFKMGRHPSTIDFKPYVKFFFDLQREMKVDADLREVCGDILTIEDVDDKRLALPLFFLEEIFYGIAFPRFSSMYEEYRFWHGNNTLLMYLFKSLLIPFFNFYDRTYNHFGYDVMKLGITTGKMDELPRLKDYYVMYKKDYAKRYSTDSHSAFYRKSALRKKKGLVDYPSYSSERATLEELEKQNSYFIRDLTSNFNIKDDEE